MERKTIYKSMKLSGEAYKRAQEHLMKEFVNLNEQAPYSKEAQCLSMQMEEALRRFQETGNLEDAIICANIRG